jgi:hypothetical protein
VTYTPHQSHARNQMAAVRPLWPRRPEAVIAHRDMRLSCHGAKRFQSGSAKRIHRPLEFETAERLVQRFHFSVHAALSRAGVLPPSIALGPMRARSSATRPAAFVLHSSTLRAAVRS